MNELNNIGDILCNICIDIIKCMSCEYGLSYGLINILLFVIIQPLCILLYGAAAQIGMNNTNKCKSNIAKGCFIVSTILLFTEIVAIGYIVFLIICNVPIQD